MIFIIWGKCHIRNIATLSLNREFSVMNFPAHLCPDNLRIPFCCHGRLLSNPAGLPENTKGQLLQGAVTAYSLQPFFQPPSPSAALLKVPPKCHLIIIPNSTYCSRTVAHTPGTGDCGLQSGKTQSLLPGAANT